MFLLQTQISNFKQIVLFYCLSFHYSWCCPISANSEESSLLQLQNDLLPNSMKIVPWNAKCRGTQRPNFSKYIRSVLNGVLYALEAGFMNLELPDFFGELCSSISKILGNLLVSCESFSSLQVCSKRERPVPALLSSEIFRGRFL